MYFSTCGEFILSVRECHWTFNFHLESVFKRCVVELPFVFSFDTFHCYLVLLWFVFCSILLLHIQFLFCYYYIRNSTFLSSDAPVHAFFHHQSSLVWTPYYYYDFFHPTYYYHFYKALFSMNIRYLGYYDVGCQLLWEGNLLFYRFWASPIYRWRRYEKRKLKANTSGTNSKLDHMIPVSLGVPLLILSPLKNKTFFFLPHLLCVHPYPLSRH